MSYDLHSVIKRTVAFYVDMLLVTVADSQYLVSVIIVPACSVNFQFNTKVALGITVEYGFGLVAVVVDRLVSVNFLMVTF